MLNKSKDALPVSGVIISAAKGLTVGIISAAVLVFSLTAVAYGTKDPDSLTSLFGYLSLYLSAAIAGGCAARMYGETDVCAILSGTVSGIMLLVLIICVSFIPAEAPENSISTAMYILMYAAIPVVSSLGGFIMKKRPRKTMRHRRRH